MIKHEIIEMADRIEGMERVLVQQNKIMINLAEKFDDQKSTQVETPEEYSSGQED